jgi:hypothetical protein
VIIQLISGASGKNAVGNGMKNVSLGNAGNTIAGAMGGFGAGQTLSSLMPALTGAATTGAAAGAGGLDIGSIIGEFVDGGVGGAIITAFVGLIEDAMAGQKV